MMGLDTARGRQSFALAAFLLIQTVAAVYFVGDALGDLVANPTAPHSVYEALVAVALLMGILFGMTALRRTLLRMKAQEQTIAAASGLLVEVIQAQFSEWGLTPAETDVGLLALKGLDLTQIAELRGAAPGTVRAQMARIYSKAGVSGRAQFAAFFVEDLLGTGVIPQQKPAA